MSEHGGIPDDYRLPSDRESLGQAVRREWIKWASEQDSPKPSWLVEWEGLSEPDREVDRRIGEALYIVGYINGLANCPRPHDTTTTPLPNPSTSEGENDG